MERLFTVIVPKQPRNKRNMKYPPVNGEKALKCMTVLHGRGFTTIAETVSFGNVTEYLTLAEMQAIYAEAYG